MTLGIRLPQLHTAPLSITFCLNNMQSSSHTANTTESSSPEQDAKSPRSICHVLPCNIDYTGAIDGRSFQPQTLEHESPTVQAVNLRGRGLLASAPATAIRSDVATGHIWQVQSETVLVNSTWTFDAVQEWHHEHIPASVNAPLTDSRIEDAVEWCQVAQALHAPLPVEQE